MEIKTSVIGDTVETSFFRLSGGRKDFTYAQALGDLIAKGKPVEDAKKLIQDCYDENVSHETDEVTLSKLNEDTKELFKYFRWHTDTKGAMSLYIKLRDDAETFVSSRNLLDSAQAVELDQKDMTIYAHMEREFEKLVLSKKISFYHIILGGKKVFPGLQYYWDKFAFELWKSDSDFRLKHTPVGISIDKKVPCFFLFEKERLKKGKTPAWDGWLSQFPEICKPVFKAWVYSIFEPTNKGRQAIWLHDNGYTGKSSVIEAISNYLGKDAVGTISGGSMKTNFAFEPLYGKRLVTYGDCKEPNLIKTPKIHSLLGNDYVTIEPKGLPAFTAKLHAKLLIASNIAPAIDFTANNERTRILYIPLREAKADVLRKYTLTDEKGEIVRYKDGTPIYKGGQLAKELTAEMDYFIFDCAKEYQNLCSNGQDIIVSQEYLNLMKKYCISEDTLKFSNLCSQFLIFDDGVDTYIPQGTLLKFYNGATTGHAYRTNGHSDFARFKKYLIDVHGVKQSKTKQRSIMTDILRGVILNEDGKDKADAWEENNKPAKKADIALDVDEDEDDEDVL